MEVSERNEREEREEIGRPNEEEGKNFHFS